MNAIKSVLLLALLATAGIAQAELEVIGLKNRRVEDVIPILQPLLEPGGALSGMNGQLIIRSSARNIAELRRVLDAVDTAPRRLLISVRQDAQGASEQRGASVGGNVSIGGGRTVVGIDSANERGVGPGARPGINARITDSRTVTDERVTQTLQVMEGGAAQIQVGQSVPVATRNVTRTPFGLATTDSIAYRDVTTGFSVVPRLSGERVTLEINPQRDTLGAGGAVNVQRVTSTVSGRLGEWMELGGIGQDMNAQSSGILSSAQGSRQDNRRVWVKVDELR
jgi:type II secretory pathway component GspD/PulD (secretin)